MSRRAFYAGFVVDEAICTHELGRFDHHFVAADLAQSTFGEQSSVSNIIVWGSVEDLIADHQQKSPMTP